MALMIPCGHCGNRSVDEFLYGEVPSVPDHIIDPHERDIDRVFMRANPNGPAPEAWFHVSGCRRWSYLTRDRSTDTWL